MQIEGKELSVLIDQYNQEIDTLKSKLLSGVPWEELAAVRHNITKLAIAIHKSHQHTSSFELVSELNNTSLITPRQASV